MDWNATFCIKLHQSMIHVMYWEAEFSKCKKYFISLNKDVCIYIKMVNKEFWLFSCDLQIYKYINKSAINSRGPTTVDSGVTNNSSNTKPPCCVMVFQWLADCRWFPWERQVETSLESLWGNLPNWHSCVL